MHLRITCLNLGCKDSCAYDVIYSRTKALTGFLSIEAKKQLQPNLTNIDNDRYNLFDFCVVREVSFVLFLTPNY